ncbi:hypothetical protein [Hyphomicrobium sp.]|uniref:hypothetical protein n=1 Tax=Hyphomicrobium sp. TaxID=82 RepID=UPI001DAC365D|nr:hypothetical protein [Hyphomicrobium sp.]MBY0561493.1 hypothetical protein [Hyphomicrobium sp.]
MTLYYVQADDDDGNSLDLFVRQDDGGNYNREAVLKYWRDYWNTNAEGGIDQGDDASIADDEFPTRVFSVNETTIGVLKWDDPSGAKVVDELENA